MIDAGKLQVLGIVQEQHAERTKLYKQWKQYQWPIVQDSLNLLQVKVVPLVIALDEKGMVVNHRADAKFVEKWLAGDIEVKAIESEPIEQSPFAAARKEFLSPGNATLDKAISIYQEHLSGAESTNSAGHFEAAVCYRNRFERDSDPNDFQKAIDHWSTALELDPNQYIYRRRIEQYGARLGKPYPFYDWVATAQSEIRERGESPVELIVEISGAEIASPLRKFEATNAMVDWESANKIDADESDLIQATAVAVPVVVQPGKATRVHVLVNPGSNARWNNEAGPTSFLLGPAEEGASFSRNSFEFPLPDDPETNETRRFEFEVLIDKEAGETVTIKGAVLVNVCISDSGVCTYLRKPFEIKLQVEPKD